MGRLQLQIIIGLVLAIATIWLVAQVGGNEESRMARAETARHATAVENGAALYETHCSECHGVRGEGVGQLGPPLNDEAFFTTRLSEVGWLDTLESYIIATVTHGRLVATVPLYAGDGVAAVMAPWAIEYGGPLRDDEIRDVTAFVLNWEATALGEVELTQVEAPVSSASDPQAITRGEEQFVTSCGECHTVEGVSSGELAPDLTEINAVVPTHNPELDAEGYIRVSVLVPNAHYVEGYEPGQTEATCGAILSEQQLDEVVTFLLAQ
jgi:mono/diheme cytochrome c family protein